MKAHDLLDLAARNLRESLLRNSLTTLGITVGVASLVAMLSLGVGLQELVGQRLSRSGLFDTIVVFSGQEGRRADPGERRARTGTSPARPLDQQARAEIEKLPNVKEVFPEVRFVTAVRLGSESGARYPMVAGLPPSARENEAFDTLQGQFFSAPEAEEAILQLDFAKDLAENPTALVGQELVLQYAERKPLPEAAGGSPDGEDWGFSVLRREKKLRIVGLIENEPYAGRNFARGRVFIPIRLAETLNALQPSSLRDALRTSPARPTYNSLQVRVTSPTQVQATQDALKKMGFSTFSILDATRNLRRFFVIVDLFLGIFGSLALAVASLGIINTLVMAILERRREIGIMKALGASDGDVKKLFFTEAAVMGFAGGVAGVTLGWAIGRVINFGTNIYLRQRELPPETILSVPWWLALAAIAFAILVSLASGIYPAARAAKLDPVQALRYE